MIRCKCCGKFISYEETANGNAEFYHEPSSHFGKEINEWTCKKCMAKGNNK
jgi:hypothetical protein